MEKNVLVFYFCFSQHFVVLILQSVHYITIWICYFAELHVTSIPYASLTPLHVTKLKYEFKKKCEHYNINYLQKVGINVYSKTTFLFLIL